MFLIIQRFFFIAGAAFFIFCLVDGAASGVLAMKWRAGEDVLGLSVWDHLEYGLGFPTLVRDALYAVLPETFVSWVLGLPAGIFFPIRLAMNAVFGAFSMRISRAARDRREERS